MHHSNTNRRIGSDYRTTQLHADIESIKNTMDTNIELLMKRGNVMEELLEQSDDLLMESQIFHKRSTNLKRAMKKKSLYYKMLLFGFAVFTIYLMMVKLCGFDLSCEADSSSSSSSSNNNNGNKYYGGNQNKYYGGDDNQKYYDGGGR